MNSNQEFALAQLRRMSALSNGAISLDKVEEIGDRATVILRLALGHLRHALAGIEVGPVESFLVSIGPDFPNAVPIVLVLHDRWNGTPHVEYHGQLCLYLAPSIEWVPADGMHGFVERLVTWLEHAAIGTLDPPGAPHPPVASPDLAAPAIVVKADAGEPSLRLVFGVLSSEHGRLEVTEWSVQPTTDGVRPVVAAFTPDRIATFTYPETVGGLINCLAELRFATAIVIDRITEAASRHGGTDVTVLIGAGSREGNSGTVTDHFVAWRVPGLKAEEMAVFKSRGAVEGYDQAVDALQAWCAEKASYHIIRDARPESVIRRDEGSPTGGFGGKSVEIWGAGALGGWMAELIVRAGAASVNVKDKSWVGPGLLVRQPFSDADILHSKALRLAERLNQISPQIQVTGSYVDVVGAELPTVDVLIDATANRSVASALERTRRRARAEGRTLPVIASAITDAKASMLFVTVAGPGYSGAAIDISRKAEARVAQRPEWEPFREGFWIDAEMGQLLRPEPGCSDPTFRGSAADSVALAAAAVTQIGGLLGQETTTGSGTAVLSVVNPETAGKTTRGESLASMTFDPDVVVPVADEDYEVRIASAADQIMREQIKKSIVTEGKQPETGGLLFGDRDDAVGTCWISVASPPPPDSTASDMEFVCGTVGTQLLTDRYARESGNTVSYIGMWHSHPRGRPEPSPRDTRTMDREAADAPHRTYLIAGGDPAAPTFAAFLGPYDLPEQVSAETATVSAVMVARPMGAGTSAGRARPSGTREVWDPLPTRSGTRQTPARRRSALEEGPDAIERHQPDPLPDGTRAIGVALSGGGFRASLAGLGSLRYLADADLLHRVRLISSVSGGSVLNGLVAQAYADLRRYQFAPEAFDELVLLPFLATVTDSSFTAQLVRNLWRATPPGSSRATVLERCLDQRFFGGMLLEELPTGCWFEFNAANVATAARFRFNRDLAGDYIVGSVSTSGSGLRLAAAVAASAAVPGLFSPMRLDATPFPCGDDHEVVLVDGGAYDNLGLDAISKRPELFFVALNSGGLFRAPRLGRHFHVPVVANLRRANAVLYRQVSAVRSRWLMSRLTDGHADGVMATLWTRFSPEERVALAEWRGVAPEQDPATAEELAGTATSFGRFDPDLARALVYRGWWLTGAAFALHQRHQVPELPGWRPI